jgi:hypothetical protein
VKTRTSAVSESRVWLSNASGLSSTCAQLLLMTRSEHAYTCCQTHIRCIYRVGVSCMPYRTTTKNHRGKLDQQLQHVDPM